MTRDEVEHEESTRKVILTQGPLVFKKEEQQQSGGKLNMCLVIIEQGVSVVTLNLKELFQYLDSISWLNEHLCYIYGRLIVHQSVLSQGRRYRAFTHVMSQTSNTGHILFE